MQLLRPGASKRCDHYEWRGRVERGIERKGGYRTWPWSTTGVHRWKKEWQARRREKNNVAGHPENKEEKGGSWDDEKRERERERRVWRSINDEPVASTGSEFKSGRRSKWRCKDKTVNHPARYPKSDASSSFERMMLLTKCTKDWEFLERIEIGDRFEKISRRDDSIYFSHLAILYFSAPLVSLRRGYLTKVAQRCLESARGLG